MSKDKTEPAEGGGKKKGKGALLIALGAVVLLGAGGGGVFALVQAGVIGEGHAEARHNNYPKLILKGEEDPYAAPVKEGEGPALVYGEGGSKYRTVYYNFEGGFTSNLRDSDSMIQVSLAASTRRDGRELMWLKAHELAIRSAFLVVLADTPEADIRTPEGKDRLQKRLTAAVNKVLIDTEGFGGIDAVQFQSFIVQ